MTARDLTVRPATRSDRTAVERVLGRAFQVEPAYHWVFPDPAQRERKLPVLMRALLRMHASLGHVDVAAAGRTVVGVAVWDAPGQVHAPPLDLLRALPAMVRAVGPGIGRLAQLQELEQHRPTEPHWYLFHLGADPAVQRRGAGSALLGAQQPRYRTYGAYLECKPENVAYYERAGFGVREEITIAGGELSMLTMWRPPARP